MAQLITITSEALQATIRRLLPSQQGFGEDLQASNVVTPIIDLTPSAEGSEFRQDLQTALAHGSATTFAVNNATDDVISTPGFYRIVGTGACHQATTVGNGIIAITDGTTQKRLWQFRVNGTGKFVSTFDFTVFLRTGDILQVVSQTAQIDVLGSVRQVANSNGELVNPVGFNPQ